MPVFNRLIERVRSAIAKEGHFTALVGGAGGLMAVRIASMGLALALHVFLARLLGATEYGHYSYAAAWVAFLQVISAVGMSDASIRYVSSYRTQGQWDLLRGFLRDSALLIVITSCLVSGLFAVAIWLSRDPFEPGSANALYMAALATPAATLAIVWSTRLRGLKQVVQSAIPMDIFHPIVFALFFAAAAFLSSRTVSGADAMLAHGAGAMSAFALAFLLFRRALPEEVGSVEPRHNRREWLGVSGPLMAMSLLVMTRARSTTLLVGLYATAEDVGYFASANRVSTLTSFGAIAIGLWAAPLISELHTRRDHAGLQRLIRLSTRSGVSLMVPMALVLILFGREILSLFGAEFRAGYETLIILTLGQLLNAFTGPVGFLMIMTGNQRIATAVEAVSTTIQIGLVIALLPGWGIEGAAVGMATATVVRNVAMFAYAWQRTGIRSSII